VKQDISIPAIATRISSEADAYRYLEELRWEGGKPDACPLCGSMKGFYFLAPRDGSEGRKTRTGSNSQRRVWKCADCRKQFSVLTGTIFHGSKIPVRTWLFVVFEMCASKNGVSAREIERKYDLTAKTAWFMLHRIREAMKPGMPLGNLLSGTVVADETWIGGKPSNQPKAKRAQRPQGWNAFTVKGEKPAVLALVHPETGEVRSRIIPDVTGATLRKAMSDHVDLSNTTLVTDEAQGYKLLRVNAEGFTTNHAEGYFSQLKRSLDGTYHRVSREHLPRYLAQFDFMYSNHEVTDTIRMERLLGQVGGRRLTYKRIAD
jgi:transposase-like protein